MISENEFYERVKSIPKTIPSISGKAFYNGFRIEGNSLYFHRVVPKTNWILNPKELYRTYISIINFLNSSIVGGMTNLIATM